jgi:hypothetical protein
MGLTYRSCFAQGETVSELDRWSALPSDDVTDQWRFRPSGYRMGHFGGPSVARIAIGIILEPKSECAINKTSGLIPAACSIGLSFKLPLSELSDRGRAKANGAT